ncbi:hypothetical protein LAC81_11140 [Ensifer adhaerens]|uniref:hypothetical protein n=1 Tax=Ensifer adhaerens TaxID=106592 RepID=UPI001CBEC411|nr:hypothetical protein [Ensifer adhaerens]MBZ7922340.1 hypothetical protein [Ensifer adhaerens]UAX90977.1 hypothetical protein LAC78_11135 [Ensifer adhaerens]UAX98606.1 hypothetical protein LAC80_11145 [Ensifer adhaerens]UAY05987.1 hypothetical protein LAC81_11140 [Ensifer adhaerens]
MVGSKTWVLDMIRELGLYLVASPRSRYWQLQHLRELDAERLADIGITAKEARAGRRRADPLPVPAAVRQSQAARAGAM